MYTTRAAAAPILSPARRFNAKQALIHSDAARHGALAKQRSVKLSAHGILVMGTPHQGEKSVQLGQVLGHAAHGLKSKEEGQLSSRCQHHVPPI